MANVFDRAHAFWDLDGGLFDLLLGIFGLILFFLASLLLLAGSLLAASTCVGHFVRVSSNASVFLVGTVVRSAVLVVKIGMPAPSSVQMRGSQRRELSVLLVFTDRIVVSCNKSSTKQQDQKAFKSSGRVRKRAEFRSVGGRIKKMSFFTACRVAKRSNQSYKRTPSRETPTIQRASPRFSLIKARNTLKTDGQRTIVRSFWLE